MKKAGLFVIVFTFCQLTFAQRFDLTPNYDENKVPEYRLSLIHISLRKMSRIRGFTENLP